MLHPEGYTAPEVRGFNINLGLGESRLRKGLCLLKSFEPVLPFVMGCDNGYLNFQALSLAPLECMCSISRARWLLISAIRKHLVHHSVGTFEYSCIRAFLTMRRCSLVL